MTARPSNRRSLSAALPRPWLTAGAIALSVALAGCNGETLVNNAKANKPIPEKLVAELTAKDMEKQSPLLVRLFKQEAELEVWKQDRSGNFALLKTYPICRWSGDLGPKVKEGDRQAPEGFYTISPAQMNPQSAFYLSFNMGYPNAYDKAHGRTGSQLMVHGDCSSRGCYAMTDEQISEIYALGRESFFGGQRAFQVQAYPFRMTPANMARHRNNPNMPFWKMIKQGYDHFEVTRQEPRVDVCEKRYVFDAQQPVNASRAPVFNPAGACPVYEVPQEVAEAVREKQRNDERKTADLITRGTPAAMSRAGVDGGMHPVFASKLPNAQVDTKDAEYSIAAYLPAPGTIPGHVNPPSNVMAPAPAYADPATSPMMTVSSPRVAVASAPTASAPASNATGGSFFNSLAKRVGLGKDDTPVATGSANTKSVPASPPAVIAATRAGSTQKLPEIRSSDVRSADIKPAVPKPANVLQATAKPADRPATASAQGGAGTLAGAQPVVPSSSFESRWSSFR